MKKDKELMENLVRVLNGVWECLKDRDVYDNTEKYLKELDLLVEYEIPYYEGESWDAMRLYSAGGIYGEGEYIYEDKGETLKISTDTHGQVGGTDTFWVGMTEIVKYNNDVKEGVKTRKKRAELRCNLYLGDVEGRLDNMVVKNRNKGVYESFKWLGNEGIGEDKETKERYVKDFLGVMKRFGY